MNLLKRANQCFLFLFTFANENDILIALNASIEAARAGEAGKGFAVVADKTISDSAGYSANNSKMVNEIVNFVETEKNSAISSHLGVCAQALMETIAQYQLKK